MIRAYPRRFSNYSGDLSGRYIGAMALLPPAEGSAQLDGLVRDLLACQRADGRFGDAGLSFAPQDIGREQMALLWGNGRLLVGLLEYHSSHPGKETMAAAKKLAEFLLNVRANCSRPEVMKRLVGQGASGFICFTQLIEAFAMLGRQTGERRYYEAAAEIIPWLQPRGNQHSHGYLTTLRGIAQLYQATGNTDQLRYVEGAYRDLVSSSDYTIYGGVNEYFGAGPGDAKAEERSRDEGCSEADFLRLSLQLWRATDKIEYLERAERCILNEFFFNQFNTGDFGHHTSYRYGYRATESVGRAWWCCTMHGLRAFRDISDAVVTATGDRVAVNLLLEGTWSGKSLSLDLKEVEPANPGDPMRFRALVREAPSTEITIALRRPAWASRCIFRFNGGLVAGQHRDGYHAMTQKWKKGDVLELEMDYSLSMLTRSGRTFGIREAGAEPTEAALFCGPYLLAADSASEPGFFGEPWMGNSPTDSSVIVLPALAEQGSDAEGRLEGPGSTRRSPQLRLRSRRVARQAPSHVASAFRANRARSPGPCGLAALENRGSRHRSRFSRKPEVVAHSS